MPHARFSIEPSAKKILGNDAVKGSWPRLAAARIAAQWKLKFGASVLFMGGFFVGYFLLLKYPLFKATIMPVLAWDERIPFQPGALWIYASLWLYVQLAPALLLHRAEVITYGKALIGMSSVGFLIFLFWPTKLALSKIDWDQHAAFQTLKEVDASGNACPSLHVAFALFTALSLERSLGQIRAPRVLGWINGLWCLGIAYSTLATRQHVLLDVFGGALLSLAVWLIYRRFPASSPAAD